MWENPRPPVPAFRGHPGEPFPPRGPRGFNPRLRGHGIRGRPPFPIRGVPRAPIPRFAGRGGAAWVEERISQEGQEVNRECLQEGMSPGFSRKRQAELAADSDYRALATPDMDYRERSQRGIPDVDYRDDTAIMYRERLPLPYRDRETLEFRERLAMLLELRERDAAAATLEYRQRLAAAFELREREAIAIEYKKRLAAILELRDREAAALEIRERGTGSFDLREREAKERFFREREAAALLLREREAAELILREREAAGLMLREREAAKQLCRDREAAALDLHEREAALLALREREAIALGFRDREAAAMEYRGMPGVSSARDAPAFRFGESERGMAYRDREKAELDFRDRVIIDYSKSENDTLLYREREQPGVSYMKQQAPCPDYIESDMLVTDYVAKAATDLDYRDQETIAESYSVGEPVGIGHGKKETIETTGLTNLDKTAVDVGYKGEGTGGEDYMVRDSSTLQFEKVGNALFKNSENQIPGLDYLECTDSDYREIKNADTDYRGGESADTDYREKENTDYMDKESTDNVAKQSVESENKNNKPLTQVKTPALDNIKCPTLDSAAKKLQSVFLDFRKTDSTAKRDEEIPFLSYKDTEDPDLVKPKVTPPSATESGSSNTEALNQEKFPHGVAKKGTIHIDSKQSRCSVALDSDLRSKVKAKNSEFDDKKKTDKAGGHTSDTPKKDPRSEPLRSGDQDFRNKEFAQGSNSSSSDRDFRNTSFVQKPDEDLRKGNAKTGKDLLTNPLLFSFLQLAAQELNQKQNTEDEINDSKDPEPSPSQTKPSVDYSKGGSLLTRGTAPKNETQLGSNPAELEFLGRKDSDYRNMDYKDVDMRIGYSQEKRTVDKRSHESPHSGIKDKDYRRASLPEGATRVIWMDGLPTGGTREEIMNALNAASKVPEHGVSLIGYVPGYSLGSVCVEFSLVEEAVRCMEANKGSLIFKGKKVKLKYVPNSEKWNCQQCKVVNMLSKERCWQCSALRAGSDHLPLRDSKKDVAQRDKKSKGNRSPSSTSSKRWKEKSSSRQSSPVEDQRRMDKGPVNPESVSSTIIIKGITVETSPLDVVKALKSLVQLSPSNARIIKNRKKEGEGTFGFIELESHKEALRVLQQIRGLYPPLTILGKTIKASLAIGQKGKPDPDKNKYQRATNTPGKRKRQRSRRRSFSQNDSGDASSSSYVYYPKSDLYIDPKTKKVQPLTEGQGSHQGKDKGSEDRLSGSRRERYHSPSPPRGKRDRYSQRADGEEKEEGEPRAKRGFKEDVGKSLDDEPFKKPLPPPMVKKEQPPPEPKVNPLIGLIGEYGGDSEEEEEEEEEEVLLPPLPKKPPPPPPRTTPAPTVPSPMAAPKPAILTPASSTPDNLIDWKKITCLLCRRQFPNKETLIKHQQLSDLHKQNLAIHQKIKQSEKELAYLQQREREVTKEGFDGSSTWTLS
ncbi:uncharacterized protein WCC33_007611 isoform 2-T2 [Rhinophrynus dorsalis]